MFAPEDQMRLADAAPELLNSLVSLLVAFDVELPTGCPRPEISDTNHWDVARDAIRKALGLPTT